MPSSRCNHIPLVIGLMRQFKPTSILDIGVGFGKWGALFREYTEIIHSEDDPPRYQRENWQVRIDGIEGFARYITPAHEYIYNHLYIGDMREQIEQVGRYDVIFLGDVIEHVTKSDGLALLQKALARANQAVIVSTPAVEIAQNALCDNPLEIHRSSWTAADFKQIGRCLTTRVENDILLAVLLAEGAPVPVFESVRRKPLLRRVKSRLRPLKRLLERLGLVQRSVPQA